ncbi:hypothetical protein [Mixta calida]|uniref:hypothetical protein n=1 Tax=Mixta calida TaxID=665913 RepID=UPI0034D7480E
MNTESYDLDEMGWFKFADGATTADLMVDFGAAVAKLSVSEPAADAGGHYLLAGRAMKVQPPLICWVRAAAPGTRISVSNYAAA